MGVTPHGVFSINAPVKLDAALLLERDQVSELFFVFVPLRSTLTSSQMIVLMVISRCPR